MAGSLHCKLYVCITFYKVVCKYVASESTGSTWGPIVRQNKIFTSVLCYKFRDVRRRRTFNRNIGTETSFRISRVRMNITWCVSALVIQSAGNVFCISANFIIITHNDRNVFNFRQNKQKLTKCTSGLGNVEAHTGSARLSRSLVLGDRYRNGWVLCSSVIISKSLVEFGAKLSCIVSSCKFVMGFPGHLQARVLFPRDV